jgi:drug/metabolite transporter (DMT)-like permease
VGALVALLSGAGWGASDFLGGLATRYKPVPSVLAVAQVAGLVLVFILYGAAGTQPLGQRHELWSVGAGLASVAALGLLYLASTRGPIAVVAPIAAADVIVPVAVGLAQGPGVKAATGVGLALAIGGVIVSALVPRDDGDGYPRRRASRAAIAQGALLAAGSAACSGLFFVFLSHASTGDPFAAAAIMHLTSCAVVLAAFGALAVTRPRRKRSGVGTQVPIAVTQAVRAARVMYGPGIALATSLVASGWLAAAVTGLADGAAEVCFAAAGPGGRLAVAAVLASLCPAVTALLALLALRDRPGATATAGIAVTLAGVALVAATGVPVG